MSVTMFQEDPITANISIANVSFERAVIVIKKAILKPSYTWRALKSCLQTVFVMVRLYGDQTSKCHVNVAVVYKFPMKVTSIALESHTRQLNKINKMDQL